MVVTVCVLIPIRCWKMKGLGGVDLNSEYRDERKDAIKRAIESMLVRSNSQQPELRFR
jgi:hypothetical protein